MNWIMYFIMFILGAISMFMMVCIGYAAKQEEPVNRVHFYVARDENGELWLYIGKPGIRILGRGSNFKLYGLNEHDYKDLKCEDKPIEVFINMED